MINKRTVLFYRNYKRFSGGQLKVRDYFYHVNQSPQHRAEIFLSPESAPENIWTGEPGLVGTYDPEGADVLFLASKDWKYLDPYPNIERRKPVINLIQGMKHANPGDPRFQFLSRRAVRICVSADVATSLQASNACNGPIYLIPNGIDFTDLPSPQERSIDVFIAGLKQRHLAKDLASRLRAAGLSVDCATKRVTRSDFLNRMAQSMIAVVLPSMSEGFFLPALEAMALGCAVVCPDCIGNREFCIDQETCLMPLPSLPALEQSVHAVRRETALRSSLIAAASAMCKRFDIGREREEFLKLLSAV